MKKTGLLHLAFLACAASPEVQSRPRPENQTAHPAQQGVDTSARDACRKLMDETNHALYRVGSSCDRKKLNRLGDLWVDMQVVCGRIPAQERLSSSMERERARISDHTRFVIEGCITSGVDEAGDELENVGREIDGALEKPESPK